MMSILTYPMIPKLAYSGGKMLLFSADAEAQNA